MTNLQRIFALVKITVFGIDILLAWIYFLSILFNRRVHHHLSALTINICLSMICTAMYYMAFFIEEEFNSQNLFTDRICSFLFYLQSICNCLTPFSLSILTIHRFCAIKYSTKRFFKTKIFLMICIASQWIVACVISLPFQLNIQPVMNIFFFQ